MRTLTSPISSVGENSPEELGIIRTYFYSGVKPPFFQEYSTGRGGASYFRYPRVAVGTPCVILGRLSGIPRAALDTEDTYIWDIPDGMIPTGWFCEGSVPVVTGPIKKGFPVKPSESGVTVFCNRHGALTAVLFGTKLHIIGMHKAGNGADVGVNELDRLFSVLSWFRAPEKEASKISPPQITVGGDIEFTICDSAGELHSPVEFFTDSQESEIGTDGNVETLEMRLAPSTDPTDVVDNLEYLLKNVREVLPDGIDLWGGGGGDIRRSTGLHIHFSGTTFDHRAHNHTRLRDVVEWLDRLIGLPVANWMRGAERGDPHYGQPGDYRTKSNHGEFAHNGWEWRMLPTCVPDKRFTVALFRIAKAIVETVETGAIVKFDEENFSVKWYSSLHGADKIAADIAYFVNTVRAGTKINVPVLNTWFGKSFRKDKECDVRVRFSNSDESLAIREFLMYDPQKRFDTIVFGSTSGPYIKISQSCKSLQDYLLKSRGLTTEVVDTAVSAAFEAKYKNGRTLFILLPTALLNKLARQSGGSRNRVKMFAQDVVKNM